jgi:protein-L-isoaspartate(D-aspartate) O-methyltransferase
MSGNRLKILAGLLVAVLVLLVGILVWRVVAGGEQAGPEALPASSPTVGSPVASPSLDRYGEEREQMVVYQIKGRGVSDAELLQAMNSVPRHEFVPADYLDLAYSDQPLPIGHGQTISQPYIVALMTELLELQLGDRVLEIGTGSGYQAAVLAELGVEVYSVEIIPELAQSARELLDRIG